MSWYDEPAPAPAENPTPAAPARHTIGKGVRRGIATAVLSVGLLVVGGVAVVSAADPASSAAPSATAQPSPGGTTNGPAPDTGTHQRHGSANGRTDPNGGGNCPAKGAAGGSSGGSGSSPAPSTNDSTSSPSTSDL